MRKVTIKLINELECDIIGLNTYDSECLYDQYGMHVKNHFHMPLVKLGSWDGKKRLFSYEGRTFIYLLQTLVPKIIERGYEIKIEDERRQFPLPDMQVDEKIFSEFLDEYGDPTIIRDYQVMGINAVLKEHGGILIAGTGAGKTIISAVITKMYGDLGLKVVTIVPTASLVLQSSKAFNSWGLESGRLDKDVKDVNKQHLVTTWQSLQNVAVLLANFDVIIIDECQSAQASVLSKLIQEYGKNSLVRIGLTGTMPEYPLDNLMVRAMLGDIRYEIPAHALIANDYLSTIDIEVLQLQETCPDDYFPDYAAEMSYLRGNDQRNLWIHNFVQEKSQMPKGNVLMLVTSKQFGKKFIKMFPDAHFVCGDDHVKDRAKIYDLFKNNDNLIVITTVQVAGTGLSIDRVFNLILMDLGKSFVRVIQAIGRGLRRNSKAGKTHCDIFDISSNLKYSKRHQSKRTKHYKEQQYPFKVIKQQYRTFEMEDLID